VKQTVALLKGTAICPLAVTSPPANRLLTSPPQPWRQPWRLQNEEDMSYWFNLLYVSPLIGPAANADESDAGQIAS
jgi:hypothetical protein